MSRTISNSDDMIDSRDILERINELTDTDERDGEEQDELDALVALEEEAQGYAEGWSYGVT
jgi:hypothetical protein